VSHFDGCCSSDAVVANDVAPRLPRRPRMNPVSGRVYFDTIQVLACAGHFMGSQHSSWRTMTGRQPGDVSVVHANVGSVLSPRNAALASPGSDEAGNSNVLGTRPGTIPAIAAYWASMSALLCRKSPHLSSHGAETMLAAAEAAVELRCRGALHSSTPLRGRSLKQHEVTGGTRWRIVNGFISGLFEVRCGLHFLFVVANVCVF